MEYAPLIIPTMNRIDHFRRCVESLQRNPWAIYTHLLISIDYPLKKEHWNGYEELKEFASNICGFKKVSVYIQKENLGLLDNQYYLINKVKEFGYDRFILSEDDNSFSPNFIEFMDRGLEKFEKNEKVFAICSQSVLYTDIDGNYFFSPWVSIWGIGYWINKHEKMDKTLNRAYFDEIARSASKRRRLLKISPAIYWFFASDLVEEVPALRKKDGEVASIDVAQSIYCITERMYCIYPKIRKERQWGYDGSGLNCDVENGFDPSKVVIDENDTFPQFITDKEIYKHSKENNEIFKIKRNYPGKKKLIRSFLIITGKRILSDNLFKKYKKLIQSVHFNRS